MGRLRARDFDAPQDEFEFMDGHVTPIYPADVATIEMALELEDRRTALTGREALDALRQIARRVLKDATPEQIDSLSPKAIQSAVGAVIRQASEVADAVGES